MDLTFVSRRIQSTRPGRSKILGCVVDYQNPVQILSLEGWNYFQQIRSRENSEIDMASIARIEPPKMERFCRKAVPC